MSDTNDALVGMMIGRIEVLEHARLRAMILILNHEPEQDALLRELESDLRSFVLSLPMAPEEIQDNARRKSDELIGQLTSFLHPTRHTNS